MSGTVWLASLFRGGVPFVRALLMGLVLGQLLAYLSTPQPHVMHPPFQEYDSICDSICPLCGDLDRAEDAIFSSAGNNSNASSNSNHKRRPEKQVKVVEGAKGQLLSVIGHMAGRKLVCSCCYWLVFTWPSAYFPAIVFDLHHTCRCCCCLNQFSLASIAYSVSHDTKCCWPAANPNALLYLSITLWKESIHAKVDVRHTKFAPHQSCLLWECI